MSVLVNFAMFPTDKGGGVSDAVSKVIGLIRESGIAYQLTSMSTTIETETMQEAMNLINKAHLVLEKEHDRIYTTITIDARKGEMGRMDSKIAAVEAKIGTVQK